MGVYDYINGEQVKCFYTPVYSELEGVWHSGGDLNSYYNNDNVPNKCMYYKYPSNFMIFDYNENLDECKIHVIRDNKVFNTFDINTIDNDYFEDNELVINYLGEDIYNIKSVEDIKGYIEDTKEYHKRIKELRSGSDNFYEGFLESLRKIEKFEEVKDTLKVFDLLNEKYFEEFKLLLEEKEIYSLKDLKSKKDIIFDKEYMNRFNSLFLEVLEKEFNDLDEKHLNKLEEENLIIEPYTINYLEKWYLEDEYYLEKKFGEYLYLIINLYEDKDLEPTIFDNMKRYISCRDKFREFIEENEDIKNKYIKWNELDSEDIELLDNILETTLG